MNTESDDDDNSQFDGFSAEDVEMAEQLLAVVTKPTVLSDDKPDSDPQQSDSTDYDSPGQ